MRSWCAVCVLLVLAGCGRFASPETRVARADAAMAAGNYGAAVVELKNALKKRPDFDQAHLLLAEAALWLGDTRGADAELAKIKGEVDAKRRADIEVRVALAQGKADEVLQRLAQNPQLLPKGQLELRRAQALMRLARFGEAQQAFAAASAADPELIEARAGLLEARFVDGDRAGAQAGLLELTKTEPESAEVWLTYGLTLAGNSDFKATIDALQRARTLAPKQLSMPRQASLLVALTEAQLQSGDIKGAADSSGALSRVAPDTPVANYIAARIAMANNDYKGAVDKLRKLKQTAPGFLEARMLLGMALLAEGNAQQASVELNEVLVQNPAHAGARQLLAQVRLQLDNPDGALRMLAPAMNTDADDSQVNALIEAARSRLGAQQSVALLEEMAEQDPQNRGLASQLANAYLQAGEPDKAVALLRKGGENADDVRRAAALLGGLAASEGAGAARREIESMLAANPKSPYLANLAAALYARTGDFGAARRTLQAALDKGADPSTVLLTLGQLEWSAGDRPAASAAIARLLELQPGNAAAHMAAGEIAMVGGDLDAARTHFDEVRKARPNSIDARMRLAQLALRGGAMKTADDLLAEAIALAPKRADVQNAAGVLNLNSGRADQAITHFRAATELDPKSALGWFNLARAQHALGQKLAEQSSLARAVEVQPDWLPAQSALAFREIESGATEAALARAAAYREKHPRDVAAFAFEGDIAFAARRVPAALDAYRAAYNLKAAALLAEKFYRASMAANVGDPTELLKRWSRANPGDDAARAMLAEAALRSGERQRAIDEYRAVLRAHPQDVVALNNLAWLYHQAGDARAVDLARQAARLAPQSAGVLDTLGWILVKDGKTDEGLSYLTKAASGPNPDPEIRYHLAAALAQGKRPAEARKLLEELLNGPAKFPSRAEAQGLLTELGGTTARGG
jgi:putative PEP-CTERM system TPR-repeat lipoprotein